MKKKRKEMSGCLSDQTHPDVRGMRVHCKTVQDSQTGEIHGTAITHLAVS